MNTNGVLVCRLVEDLPAEIAQITRSVKRNCKNCGAEIWVSPMDMNAQLLLTLMCSPCALAVVDQQIDAGKKVEVISPSRFTEKVRELRRKVIERN